MREDCDWRKRDCGSFIRDCPDSRHPTLAQKERENLEPLKRQVQGTSGFVMH